MTQSPTLSTRRSLPLMGGSLGVLSIHLDGVPCRVGCAFCYLGARVANQNGAGELDLRLVEELLARLEYDEVAVAVSEPAETWLAPLRAIVAAATAKGRPVAVTTTGAVISRTPEVLEAVARVNLSVDPTKGSTAATAVARWARRAKAAAPRIEGREVVLIVSLASEEFAEEVIGGGLLAELLALEDVDRVALNALKPPPPWCDRKFWLRSCARLAPLLERHLDRRLFLDCYVAARILELGGCPARADVSPGPEFRSCVYQAAPDFRFDTAEQLAERLRGFVPPAVCPFPIV